MTVDPSARGRANLRRGATAETRVAAWLRGHGWPAACRAVRNTDPDPGDIAETHPQLWWSVKDCQRERLDAWMAEAREKARLRLAVLVVRRRGHADPGTWWAHLALGDLSELLGGVPRWVPTQQDQARLQLATLATLLAAAGFTTEDGE